MFRDAHRLFDAVHHDGGARGTNNSLLGEDGIAEVLLSRLVSSGLVWARLPIERSLSPALLRLIMMMLPPYHVITIEECIYVLTIHVLSFAGVPLLTQPADDRCDKAFP